MIAGSFSDLDVDRESYNTVLCLKDGTWEVETLEKLPEGIQPQISVEELLLCEEIARADERVQKLAKEVGKSLDRVLCRSGHLLTHYTQ